MVFDPQKLAKLQAKSAIARTGGKGTVRRKHKATRKVAVHDDKRLKSTLNRLNVRDIPAIEEVNLFKEDGQVIHFVNPKVQASIAANTYVVSGQCDTKKLQDLLPGIITQLGPDNLEYLKKIYESYGDKFSQKPAEGDDDVPELVENFEDVSKSKKKKEDSDSAKPAAAHAHAHAHSHDHHHDHDHPHDHSHDHDHDHSHKKKDKAPDQPKDKAKDKVQDQPKDKAKDKVQDQPKDKVQDQPKDKAQDQPKAKDKVQDQAKDKAKDKDKDEAEDDEGEDEEGEGDEAEAEAEAEEEEEEEEGGKADKHDPDNTLGVD